MGNGIQIFDFQIQSCNHCVYLRLPLWYGRRQDIRGLPLRLQQREWSQFHGAGQWGRGQARGYESRCGCYRPQDLESLTIHCFHFSPCCARGPRKGGFVPLTSHPTYSWRFKAGKVDLNGWAGSQGPHQMMLCAGCLTGITSLAIAATL